MTEEPLSLRHTEILRSRLKAINTQVSEYSFANLYLFRSEHDYSVITDDEIFIRGKTYDNDSYLMPTRDVRITDQALLDRRIAEGGMLFPVLEEWLPRFQDPRYSVEYRDSDSDYIIDIGKLTTYQGNKLHDKKNLLNQFLRRYQCDALPLTDDRLGDAQTVLDTWQQETGLPIPETDYHACYEAISLYEKLILCGGIYYIDSRPVGFIIGEELDSVTFAVHFAKALREFKGIYQYMYHQFAGIMPQKYTSFNFEQDLGLESLRHMKASYQPKEILKKYRITLK